MADQQRVTRKLAAILYADVVGYSRLTGADEEGTHSIVADCLDAISGKVSSHGGRVVHYAGDAVLADFPSVVTAVKCAVEVQKELAARNVDIPDDRKVQFRIGVNLGDVIVDRDDIYGNGVNVAARLETLADPGGVCVSEKVLEEVQGKVGVGFEDMGPQQVKNIAKPVHTYRVVLNQQSGIPSPPLTDKPLPLADKPSIAVLPFTNMSGDPEQEYFADGISEDIITELARFPDLVVIARNSTFTFKGRPAKVQDVCNDLGVRYVLEGSVRKGGRKVRITAQLIDGKTGDHIWADRYERALTDIFEVQDEITQAVVASVPERIASAELDRVKRKLPCDMSAYDYVLRGKRHHHRCTPEDNAEALRLFDAAIKLDPEYAAAYAWKACILGQAAALGCGGDPRELLARDIEAARKGLSLDENDIECHRVLCELAMMRSHWDDAQRHHEKAFELNPNDARIIAQRGELFTKLGQAEEGVTWVQRAMQIDPFGADARAHLLGRALFGAHRYVDAIAAFKRIPIPQPDHLADMAACYAQLERDDEARACAAKVLGLRPDFSVSNCIERRTLKVLDDSIRLRDSLLKSGLPE